MQFATFYKLSLGYVPGSIPPRFSADHVKPIEALGSDGVAVFDGRYGIERCASEARDICRKRGYIGFTLSAGQSFTRSREIRKLEKLES